MSKVKQISFLRVCCILLGAILIWNGTECFWNGLHNADLAQNIYRIDMQANLNLEDVNSKLEKWSIMEMYIYGMNGMKKGFWIFGIGCFLIGISIGDLVNWDD